MIALAPASCRVVRPVPRRASVTPRANNPNPFPLPLALDPVAVVEKLAESALLFILVRRQSVRVRVDASIQDALLSGTLRCRGASVSGRDWRSPRALSCREIDMRVGACELDSAALASGRGIRFRAPARGRASLRFDGTDWGNFLTHDLMREAAARARSTFEFEGGASARVSSAASDERLEFRVRTRRDGRSHACEMRPRANGGVDVRVSSSNATETETEALATELRAFFETLVVDLDGSELAYRSMTIDRVQSTVTFDLDLVVNRFPTPAVRF